MSPQNTSLKPALTVIVGAGASVPIGVPSTSSLTMLVKEGLRAHRQFDAADPPFLPRVEKLLAAAESYYGDDFNFEHLLDVVESGHALSVGWRPGKYVTTSEVCLTQPTTDLAELMDSSFFHQCSFALRRTVLGAVTSASDGASAHGSWPTYKAFWTELAANFELTVVTLNYDTLVEQALSLDGGHQGFTRVGGEQVWRIDPRSLHAPASDHRLFHLHGSIHFGSREYGSEANRFWHEDSFHDLYWHPTPAVGGLMDP